MRGMLRAAGLGAAVLAAASCNGIDTTRVAPPKGTLGDDIYGVFCDRVGTSAFPEDLTGGSFYSVCHYDDQGHYGDKVDEKQLPRRKDLSAAQLRARDLSLAKVERMGQRRGDLIRALNRIFPADAKIPVPGDATATIRLDDALFDLAQTLTPLYETNPIEPKGAPLLPTQTRALGRLFDAFAAQGTCAGGTKSCAWDAECGTKGICQHPVRDALSRVWARRGYRPAPVGLGMVAPALGYPDLRKLTLSTLSVLGPGGSAASELQQVLTVAQQELVTAKVTVSSLPPLAVDAAVAEPNRPRQDIEFLSSLFLTTDAAFGADTGLPKMLIARRDGRGFVVPKGNVPGVPGTVPAPFVDLGNDGFADVDNFGRFIDASGAALGLDAPFALPGETMGPINAQGQPESVATTYETLDTSRTLIGALTKHLVPLLDPTILAAGDPKPWASEHESLMYAMAGAYTLFGDRVDATYDYGQEGPGGKTVKYRGFNPDTSPLPDLIHAAGQILADEDSDALLLSLLDLAQNHEQQVARLLGAALKIQEISKQHDVLAAQGTEKAAGLDYTVTLWDEMAKILSEILKHPGLLQGLLEAMADDTVVTPFGNSDHMGTALARFLSFRDEMSYPPHGKHLDGSAGGINGPAVNVTIGGGSIQDPQTPVDRNSAQAGKNMSCLQRSLMLIHDSNGGPACNKEGAVVESVVGGISLAWPITGFPIYASPYHECEFFKIDNLAMFYLDSMLPPDHPKRSQLKISGFLNDVITYLGGVLNPDQMFQDSSDIKGLGLHPEPFALNRLVFYGASSDLYPSMPDFDQVNQNGQTNSFVGHLIEPVSSAWCPADGNGVPVCADKASTLRMRDANTIFLWERYGFSDYLRPMVKAFANVSCAPDLSSCNTADFAGESIFVALFELLNKHWPGPDHGAECKKGSPTIPCSEAGLNRYEPLLSDAFVTDIIPALHEFAKVAVEVSKVTVKRGPNAGKVMTGADVLEKMTKILFSTDYAAAHNMVDRTGNKATTWVDGTPQAQLTGYTLFADALHKMDTRFATACDCSGKTGADQAQCMDNVTTCLADADARKAQWKRARSLLVDEFLTVENEGVNAQFHNPTVTPTLIATLQLAREQVNANCKQRESGTPCTWAKKDLGDKLAGVMSRPLFAAIVDVSDKIRQDDAARRQLEIFLQYALSSMTDDGKALQGSLATLADLLQVLADDATLTPLLQAAQSGAAPDADPKGAGAGSVSIKVLKALTDEKYDKYHVMDHVLPNLVKTDPADPNSLSPIEIIMDVIADVNRVDASDRGPMARDDYEGVTATMEGFMLDKTRGLEQLYTIIQKRPKQ
jgi:hypothetical protein